MTQNWKYVYNDRLWTDILSSGTPSLRAHKDILYNCTTSFLSAPLFQQRAIIALCIAVKCRWEDSFSTLRMNIYELRFVSRAVGELSGKGVACVNADICIQL